MTRITTFSTLSFDGPVTLVGGGALDDEAISLARRYTSATVAADGGANRFRPPRRQDERSPLDAVIGDMDSIADIEAWRAVPGCKVMPILEQDSTDFEKCLYSVAAPLYLAVGFLGARLDHSLAVLHSLIAFSDRSIILLSDHDAVFLSPVSWRARLTPGDRVSLFPLRPVRGVRSAGLEWPIDDLALQIGERIGTSNRVTEADVALSFNRRGVLVILDRERLDTAVEILWKASFG